MKYLVLLCLGADLTLLSILPGSESKTKSKSKVKKECLRVTMVHGDIVVLSGSKFEARPLCQYVIYQTNLLPPLLGQFLLVRTGMCMRKSNLITV